MLGTRGLGSLPTRRTTKQVNKYSSHILSPAVKGISGAEMAYRGLRSFKRVLKGRAENLVEFSR